MDEWNFQRFPKEEHRKLPHAPGVYKYLNSQGKIIYVGKAKDLRKRVSSYFLKTSTLSLKTDRLVRDTREIEFVIVNNEYEALLLENNLIKENQPKYNVLMKDGKSYPYICITQEHFPRVFSTRRTDDPSAEYYGPFTSVRAMNNVLNLIKKLYKIRTCNLNLSPKNIESGKFNVCLEYHIQNCKAPCVGYQSEGDYEKDIQSIRHILKGNLAPVKNSIKQELDQAVQELRYEDAQVYKEKLSSLDRFQTRSLVANPKISETDVFTIDSEGDKSFVNYMKIDEGSIRLSETIEVSRKLDEEESEILPLVMFNMRRRFKSNSRHILTNLPIETWEPVEVTVPKIGDKRKLIELSLKNVDFFKKESVNNTPAPTPEILLLLQEDFSLENIPEHIECFDNSNIQGSNPVASMVCFKNGKPSKKDYRKFKIKTVEGPDDFSSMKEVVFRRYRRLLNEDSPLPQLIVIDGGKGQLSAACEALKALDIYGEIAIIGIAKKLEEIYYPNDPYPVHINKKSGSLQLIQRIRDEAHRFAITFHRNSRSNIQTSSELDSIKGIGEKSKQILLNQYKSVQRMKKASVTEIAQYIGLSKAQILFKALNKKKDHL